MKKVKLGIIGTGYIGGVHGRIHSGDDRVEIAGLYDIISEKAEMFSRTIGGKVCASREELLDLCDAVLICTPNKTHKEIAMDALVAGRHIFCEKPFCVGAREAAELRAAANQSSPVFQVGHNRRFAPVYVKLRELLGDDTAHSAHIKMNRGELKNPEWTGDPNITGGFLYETPVHLFDMIRYQFGEVSELFAFGSQHEYPELDDFSVVFRFRNGFHCTFASSADASWHFPFERMEVFCAHRTIMTEEMEFVRDSRGMDANFETHSWHQMDRDARWGYVQEDRALIDSILHGSKPLVTADDGFEAVRLVESVYESIIADNRIRF